MTGKRATVVRSADVDRSSPTGHHVADPTAGNSHRQQQQTQAETPRTGGCTCRKARHSLHHGRRTPAMLRTIPGFANRGLRVISRRRSPTYPSGASREATTRRFERRRWTGTPEACTDGRAGGIGSPSPMALPTTYDMIKVDMALAGTSSPFHLELVCRRRTAFRGAGHAPVCRRNKRGAS